MSGHTSTTPGPLGRRFLTLWTGQTASLLGTNVAGLGVSIAAFVETGSVWWLSVLYLATRVPGLLLASVAGELVDRTDRRRVLLAADAAAGVATGTALLLLAAGGLEPWHLVVVVVVGSVANAFQEPAYLSSLPLLVPRETVDRANGMLQLGPALGLLAGPALAGILVAAFGIGGALVFDLATFVLAMVATALIRIPSPAARPAPDDAPHDPDGRPARGLGATWRSLDGRLRGLRHLLLFAAALNVVLTFVNVLLVALLLPLVGEAGLGVLLSIGGLGMLVGAVTVSARGVPERRVRAVAVATAAIGLGLVLAAVPVAGVVALGLVLTLAGAAVASAAAGAIFQTEVPLERQGRLAALRRVASEALVPVAALAVAPVAEGWAEPAMAAGGSLAASVGPVLGTGPGRGVALLFVLVGGAIVLVALVVARDQRLAVVDRLSGAADHPVPAPTAGPEMATGDRQHAGATRPTA